MTISEHFLLTNSTLRDSINESGLSVVFLSERPEEWEALLKGCNYVPVAYSIQMMNYQKAYISGAGIEIQDFFNMAR